MSPENDIKGFLYWRDKYTGEPDASEIPLSYYNHNDMYEEIDQEVHDDNDDYLWGN